jgi:hypothetical protein
MLPTHSDPLVTTPTARLDQASAALRQQLASLQAQPTLPGAGLGLGNLLTALGQYEQAVLDYLSPDPAELRSRSPEQLRAYRETQPLYRLGWIRGHQTGLGQAQLSLAPALDIYAQHAALPALTDPAALVQQVRRFLAELQLRYGPGPITATASRLAP